MVNGTRVIFVRFFPSVNENNKVSLQWKHLKMIKFCERPLTALDIFYRENNEVVVAVSDSTGQIRFLDTNMKILFWLKRPSLAGLIDISFTEHELELLGYDAEGEQSTVDKVKSFFLYPFAIFGPFFHA